MPTQPPLDSGPSVGPPFRDDQADRDSGSDTIDYGAAGSEGPAPPVSGNCYDPRLLLMGPPPGSGPSGWAQWEESEHSYNPDFTPPQLCDCNCGCRLPDDQFYTCDHCGSDVGFHCCLFHIDHMRQQCHWCRNPSGIATFTDDPDDPDYSGRRPPTRSRSRSAPPSGAAPAAPQAPALPGPAGLPLTQVPSASPPEMPIGSASSRSQSTPSTRAKWMVF